MSLTDEQRNATREELKANFDICGGTTSQVARALGFSEEKLDDALNLRESVHPADVWMLRDYLVREVTARGAAPVPFTALTSSARLDPVQWFSRRPGGPTPGPGGNR